ncbi:hypothetical protein F2Q70_00007722 [Brassica cretica]|uniref:Uncharacterized protein n=1 Tax=Brassica cretica TaxID=69181 RepID=A0A8S9LTX6_BRACR|nr:hypothetical protein F2Q70_00007722 [Brassica cretica]
MCCGCCVGVGLFIFDERLGEAGESLQSSSEEPPLPSDFRQQDDSTWKDLEETHHELEQERVGACHGGCCRGDSGRRIFLRRRLVDGNKSDDHWIPSEEDDASPAAS